MRVALGVVLDRLGNTAIRVALTEHRVDSRSQNFGVLGPDLLVLGRVTRRVLRHLLGQMKGTLEYVRRVG